MIKEIKLWWTLWKSNIEKYDLTYEEINKELTKRFPDCKIEITDLIKKTTDYKTLCAVSALMPTKFLKYKREILDCEDFAIIAWGIWKSLLPELAIGLCFVKTQTGKHCVNCCVYKEKSGNTNFTFIEPQNGKVIYTNWKPYLIIL